MGQRHNPLNYILEMDPLPDVVFFMTDGKVSEKTASRTVELVEDFLDENKITINTVVLGLPEEQAAPLKKIAEMTNGTYKNFQPNELDDMKQNLEPPPEKKSTNQIDFKEKVPRGRFNGPLGGW